MELVETQYAMFLDDECLFLQNTISSCLDHLTAFGPSVFKGKILGGLPFDKVRCIDIDEFVSGANGKQTYQSSVYLGIEYDTFN